MNLESSHECTDQPRSAILAETDHSPVVPGDSGGEQLPVSSTPEPAPPDPDELVALLLSWIRTPDWSTSQTYLQAHSELLTEAAAQVLATLTQHQSDQQVHELLALHQQLLQIAGQQGVEAAYRALLHRGDENSSATTETEQEELLVQVIAWLQTPDWETSQTYLQTHPCLLTDAAEQVLEVLKHTQEEEQIQALINLHQVLLQEARVEGIEAAYERILRSEPEIPLGATYQTIEEPAALIDIGLAALRQYCAHGQMENLNRAIDCWHKALNLTPSHSPNWPTLLNYLGIGLSYRYDCTGELTDLQAAITYFQQALQSGPSDSPDRPAWLNNLGNGLRNWYARTGKLADLEAAITYYRQALQVTPSDSPDLPSRLNNLGSGLNDRYAHTGKLADLEAAITYYRQALQVTPSDSPDLPILLNNLGNGLRDRYARTGKLADLEAAITYHQQALQSGPSDSPDRPAWLNNLGNRLRDRYARTGKLADLEAAITYYRQALQATPSDSPDLPSRLSNLGSGLSDRYARTGELADLETAITYRQQALRVTPSNSPDRAGRLNNLGSELRNRYTRTRELTDLGTAIIYYRQALQATPSNSPDRAGYLSNLGNGLSDQYELTKELADLEAAITYYRQALQATSSDSPDRVGRLNNLGNGLRNRYDHTGELADLEAAITYYRQALQAIPSDSSDRLAVLNNLGIGLRNRYAHTGELADLEAAITCYRQALQAIPSDSPDLHWYLSNLGNGLRDRYDCTREMTDLQETISVWEKSWSILNQSFATFPVTYQLGQQSQGAEVTARLVAAYLEQAKQHHHRSPDAPCRALEIVEGSKSRLLTQLVGRGPLPLPVGLSQEIAAQEQQLLAELTALDTQELATHGRLASTQEEISHLQRLQQRQRTLHELEDLWVRIASIGPEGAAYVTLRRGAALSWQELTRLAGELGPATALLSFFTTVDQAQLFLFRAGWHAPRIIEVPLKQTDWSDLLGRLFREVHRYGPGLRRNETWDQKLHPLLIETQRYLGGVERVILAPGGNGHLLPWGVLAERAGWRTSTGQALPLVTLPTLSILPKLRLRPHVPPGPTLVVGNPCSDLPYAESEAKEVAKRFGTKPLLGATATKSNVLARFSDANLIHLATHAFFAANKPLESGIVLADGVLTAREVLEHHLQADLLVLSACESGQVGSLGGEELAGLSQAFLLAGVRSLLVSLWRVNDSATAALIQAFYTARQAGADKALALRQAMTQMQQAPHWTHPYYWGAFVMMGDWD